jgi:hypothetical protein
MPAVAPYIPNKQANFTAWLANFSTLITASPNTYGLVTSDAVTIAGLNSAWVAAYTPVTSGSTKTPAAVSNKNSVEVSVKAQIRVYAQQIGNNPGVTSANKIALGLNPKTSTPSPVTAPTTNPVLTVQSASAGSLIVRYRDSAASVSVKSKPYGVKFCEIHGNASATPITVQTASNLLVNASKSPVVIDTSSFTTGMQLYFWARWRCGNGAFGPWSPIVAFTVANGS